MSGNMARVLACLAQGEALLENGLAALSRERRRAGAEGRTKAEAELLDYEQDLAMRRNGIARDRRRLEGRAEELAPTPAMLTLADGVQR